MMKLASVVACVVSLVGTVSASAEDDVSGNVLKLSKVVDKEFTVNEGGLVVVVIQDSGSRPPKDINVDFGRQYKRIGKVQGAQNDDGQFLAGGGFTWYVLKPLNVGPSTIKVTFKENDGMSTEVKREYKVTIQRATE